MATRKQRRRREQTFRHNMTLVTKDEEGNEVETTAAELRAKSGKPPKVKADPADASANKKKGAARPNTRATREPPVPSWRRSVRRALPWGGVMFVVVMLFFTQMPLAARIIWGLFYALAFIPLTYWIDRLTYRTWQRRQAKQQQS